MVLWRFLWCLYMAVLALGDQLSDWPTISNTRAAAWRTQRDICSNVSIASTVVMGIDMTKVLFDTAGYNETSIDNVRTLLNLGVQSLTMDLYFNRHDKMWNLCPPTAARNQTECSDDFTITNLVQSINGYLDTTDTVLRTSTLLLLFRLHEMNTKTKSEGGSASLHGAFSNLSSIVKPTQVDTSNLPTLKTLLVEHNIRSWSIITLNELTDASGYDFADDLKTIFVSSEVTTLNSSSSFSPLPMQYAEFSTVIEGPGNVNQSSAMLMAYDSDDTPFTTENFKKTIMTGNSPVISHRLTNLSDLSPYLDNCFWSWNADQPTVLTNDDDDDTEKYLDRCTLLTSNGWTTGNCLDKYRAFCRDSVNSSKFAITKDKSVYTLADEKCYRLNKNYEVATPHTPSEEAELIALLPSGERGIWIDVNSLSNRNCWVEGANTVCPYQKVISRAVFKRMIAPASVVAAILVIIVILIQFERVPVQKNRRHWKKVMNDRLAHEFEGVPS